jgi:hypothetical protein
MRTKDTRSSDQGQSADKRAALLDKISALLAKTKERGCTEGEALAAAELASKLMTKYGLSLSELESISTPSDVCETDAMTIGRVRAHEVLHVAGAIADYTDTRHWYQRLHDHRGVLLVYFGLATDVQVATYLTDILRNAMDTEWHLYWNAHRKDSISSPGTARANFMRGMVERISTRLYTMKAAQNEAADNNCRAIVVVKEDIVRKAFEARNINITHKARREEFFSDSSAYHAGDAAGSRVTIAKGALGDKSN